MRNWKDYKNDLNEARSTKSADLKKKILSKIKELKPRDLSVKYDGSYRIVLKKAIPLSKVEEISNELESFSRDDVTGEILSGGNTFVFVEYDDKFVIDDKLKNKLLKAKKKMGNFSDAQGATLYDRDKVNLLKRRLQKELGKEWSESDIGMLLSRINFYHKDLSKILMEAPEGFKSDNPLDFYFKGKLKVKDLIKQVGSIEKIAKKKELEGFLKNKFMIDWKVEETGIKADKIIAKVKELLKEY